MNRLNTGLVAAALALWTVPVAAQTPYPGKPIRLIVPTRRRRPERRCGTRFGQGHDRRARPSRCWSRTAPAATQASARAPC